jgi:cell wall-associated NlpC family hydrolase
MVPAVCIVPVCPLRKEPTHRSEMVSQLLFGERCQVLEPGKDQWQRVSCQYDGYEGWCSADHLTNIDITQYNQSDKQMVPDWVTNLDFNGSLMRVPFGSSVNGILDGQIIWGSNRARYKGKTWDPGQSSLVEASIRQLSYQFLNTGYLWGGKTVFGVDCSGFTQTVFKYLNIFLLRDAHEQATQGETLGFLEESRCGDLAFFDNEEGKITHVGILLNKQEIIHASGKVRIDKIDNQGIFQLENLQRTHRLRIIKRYRSLP